MQDKVSLKEHVNVTSKEKWKALCGNLEDLTYIVSDGSFGDKL